MLVPTNRSVILRLDASPDLHRPSCKIDEDGAHGADGEDISKENEGRPYKYSTYGLGNKEGHPIIKAKRDATIVTSWNIFLFDPGFFVILVFQLVRFRYFTIIFDQILFFIFFFSECPVEKARMIWPA